MREPRFDGWPMQIATWVCLVFWLPGLQAMITRGEQRPDIAAVCLSISLGAMLVWWIEYRRE